MGLDMYLSAKRYLWSFNEHDQALAKKIDAEIGANSIGRTKEISREAMYWRKANAIHNWFVINVQGGEDNCKEYYVSRAQLQELLILVFQELQILKLMSHQQELKFIQEM